MKQYVVVGGAGAMGRITVRDLFETTKDTIVIADFDLAKAQELARSLGEDRVRAVRVDVTRHDKAAEALSGAHVLINAVQYQFNLDVMEIALRVGAHYVDMGGLFHVTRKQMEYFERFRDKDLTALLGVGAAPGITNMLARFAADALEEVREIHTRVASLDHTKYAPKPALAVSYSLKTILEEFSFQPAVFTKGQFTFVKPMSGDDPHVFPKPLGVRRPMYTIHSEVATLPLSYAGKGVQEVSFKIAFDSEFVDRVRFLRDLGMASHEPISVGGAQVCPVDVVNKVAMSQPTAKQVGPLKQYEVVRAVVKGIYKKKKTTWIVDCHTQGMPQWGVGLDIDTGSPPSIAAQMILRGDVTARGAIPPEVALPCDVFFKELRRRKMTVKVQKKTGWGFKC